MEQTPHKISWLQILVIFLVSPVMMFLVDIILPKSFEKQVVLSLAIQEIAILIVLYLIDHFWIHQPLHFATTVPIKTLFFVNIPTIFYLLLSIFLALPADNQKHIPTALAIALCAGITEEVTFRGLLLPAIMTRFSGYSGMWSAVILSSLLFGGLHMLNLTRQSFTATALQGLNAFFMGLFLAALYLRTRSLIFPMLIHGLNDFASTVVTQGSINSTNTNFTPFFFIWAVYLIIALIYLRPSKTKDVYKLTMPGK